MSYLSHPPSSHSSEQTSIIQQPVGSRSRTTPPSLEGIATFVYWGNASVFGHRLVLWHISKNQMASAHARNPVQPTSLPKNWGIASLVCRVDADRFEWALRCVYSITDRTRANEQASWHVSLFLVCLNTTCANSEILIIKMLVMSRYNAENDDIQHRSVEKY